MASVYILYSQRLSRFYTGSCKELVFRLEQHLNKEFINSFTSKTGDWQLYFVIENLEYKQARLIEAHIKKMKSKTYLVNMKKYPEIIGKLKQKYS